MTKKPLACVAPKSSHNPTQNIEIASDLKAEPKLKLNSVRPASTDAGILTCESRSGMADRDGRPRWIVDSGMGRRVHSYDWSATPIGPIDSWPQALHSAVTIILNSAFPMSIWWGRDDLTYIYNDACSRHIGSAHPAALGTSARTIWSSVWSDIEPLAEQVFAGGKPIYRKNMRLFLARGAQAKPEEAYFTFSCSPIASQGAATIMGMLCAFTETTEEVLDNQRLVALNQAKDEFISLASHQLRTPATGVKQYLGMLLGDFAGELTASQRTFVQHAYDSNERQLSTVSDLLNIAQADAGKIDLHRRPTNLVVLVDKILEEQATKFSDRDQTVKFDHIEDACIAAIDTDRMRMVLENLIDNASKYTHTGKQIFISLNHPTETPAEKLDKQHEGSIRTPATVSIVIHDQGVGIAEKDIVSIFDKFIRVDNPLSEIVGGSGLGLYLARKIVELHGGAINVTSVEGLGSTFSVSLPVA